MSHSLVLIVPNPQLLFIGSQVTYEGQIITELFTLGSVQGYSTWEFELSRYLGPKFYNSSGAFYALITMIDIFLGILW
jgi:hypothetical protein